MTDRVIRRCRVDEKGNLVIPLGAVQAGTDVEVVIRPIDKGGPVKDPPMTRDEWVAFIESTSGKIDNAFSRPPQPDIPDRGWTE